MLFLYPNPNNFVPLIFKRRNHNRVIMGIIFVCRKKELAKRFEKADRNEYNLSRGCLIEEVY